MGRHGHGWVSVHLAVREVDNQPEGWVFVRDTPRDESCRKWNCIHGPSVPLVRMHLQVWNGGFNLKTLFNCEIQYIYHVKLYKKKISNWLLENLNSEKPNLSLTSPVKQLKLLMKEIYLYHQIFLKQETSMRHAEQPEQDAPKSVCLRNMVRPGVFS